MGRPRPQTCPKGELALHIARASEDLDAMPMHSVVPALRAMRHAQRLEVSTPTYSSSSRPTLSKRRPQRSQKGLETPATTLTAGVTTARTGPLDHTLVSRHTD